MNTQSISLSKLSEQLLYAVKIKSDTSALTRQISDASFPNLKTELKNDDIKKAFWINVYNAYFQIIRRANKVAKKDIYKAKVIHIAGTLFSLDDIEHGILRKYRYKYSLGLFPNLFTKKIIKNLAVDHLDYRIHFALNCGAESCPPIAFYNKDKMDAQLQMATLSFLETESVFDEKNKILHTSKLLLWFKYDFGGRKGIDKMYAKYLHKNISDFELKYKEYSWEEQLDNFRDE